jgi:hypothetical protein
VQRDRGRDDPVARLVGQVGLRDLVRVLVEQQEQQILLVPYVVVEGRRPDAELRGEPARPGGAVVRGTAPSCCPAPARGTG